MLTPTAVAFGSTTPEDARRSRQLHTLSRYTTKQQEATLRLFHAAQQMLDTSGGSTCGKLLLGLYNGERFPFDLTDLRRLDDLLHPAAMEVIHMDSRHTYCEIHVLLDALLAVPAGKTTGNTMELWAHRLGLKGRCNKAGIPDLRAHAV